MKYIRTKAGEIYNIEDLYICEELNDKPYGVKDSGWVIYKESIVKQADTIEELCDCFIGIAKSGDFIQLGKWELDAKHYDLTDIYGAVLVKEKGIIFVAKMNEKGDFELL